VSLAGILTSAMNIVANKQGHGTEISRRFQREDLDGWNCNAHCHDSIESLPAGGALFRWSTEIRAATAQRIIPTALPGLHKDSVKKVVPIAHAL
jgi:hypothetical protein